MKIMRMVPPYTAAELQQGMLDWRAYGSRRSRAHRVEVLSKGYVDKEMAEKLGISTWTVYGHLKSIFGKLRVHTRSEAVVTYLQK